MHKHMAISAPKRQQMSMAKQTKANRFVFINPGSRRLDLNGVRALNMFLLPKRPQLQSPRESNWTFICVKKCFPFWRDEIGREKIILSAAWGKLGKLGNAVRVFFNSCWFPENGENAATYAEKRRNESSNWQRWKFFNRPFLVEIGERAKFEKVPKFWNLCKMDFWISRIYKMQQIKNKFKVNFQFFVSWELWECVFQKWLFCANLLCQDGMSVFANFQKKWKTVLSKIQNFQKV